MWIFAYRHVPVSRNVVWSCVFFLQWTHLTVRRIVQTMHSNMVLYVNSCMHRRVRKLKSCAVVHRFDFSVGNWCQTRCYMFNVTHRNEFVTQKVCRHPSFSVWKRLVVDTLRGNMSVEDKHRKLCIKLYTDTCSHEKIFMRTHPCKSKKLCRGTSFHREHASQSFVWVKPMYSDMISYLENCLLRRVRKLSRVIVHRFNFVYWKFGDKHGAIC